MKTKEQLNALKEEVETVSRKLTELNEEELRQVAGGIKHFPTPNPTRFWFSVADRNAESHHGQVKVEVIRESKDLRPGGDSTVRISTNYPLSGDK